MNEKIVKVVKVVEKPVVSTLQIPFIACTHLFGEKHTAGHRMFTGAVFMVTGVGVSKLFVEIHVLHFFFDLLGYAIHGMGCLPFIEHLGIIINKAKQAAAVANDDTPPVEQVKNVAQKIAASAIPTIALLATIISKH